MRPMKRVSGFVVGEPGSGKSTLMQRWARELATHPTIASVFVLDLVRDVVWDNVGPIVESMDEYRELCRRLADQDDGFAYEEKVPRLVVWRLSDNVDPVDFVPALREAVDEGDCVTVFNEASHWFPAEGKRAWPVNEVRSDVKLESFIRLGRAHIRNREGERCATHYLADTQYPIDCHRLMRNASRTVLTSKIEGEETLRWIRAGFGVDAKRLVEQVQTLKKHKWLVLRGEMPRLAPLMK